MNKKILITGSAGFIGYHLSNYLLDNGFTVFGVDNLNEYYDVRLKLDRNKKLEKRKNFSFKKIDIRETDVIVNLIQEQNITEICHLAAQAGVRHSLEKPFAYSDSNLEGFLSILEVARRTNISKLLFASSSSVYGLNDMPTDGFVETQSVNMPASLYAATKIANEAMAFSYHDLYKIPMIGMRFFTVYGSYGRPDMAYFSFTNRIQNNNIISLYNNGNMARDFTHVSDVTDAILSAINLDTQFEIFNIGSSNPIKLKKFVEIIEKVGKKRAKIQFEPMQSGDVKNTYANINKAKKLLNFTPKIPFEEGYSEFFEWYKEYTY